MAPNKQPVAEVLSELRREGGFAVEIATGGLLPLLHPKHISFYLEIDIILINTLRNNTKHCS